MSGDEVERVVHSVGEVAVEVPGGAEHGLIPICLAPIRVRAGVAFTRIRLDLGYSKGHSAIVIRALQDAAENFGCEFEHLTGKKCPVGEMKPLQHVHARSLSTPREPSSIATFGAFATYIDLVIHRLSQLARAVLGTIAWSLVKRAWSPRLFLGAHIRKPRAVIAMIILAGALSACTAASPQAPPTVEPVASETAAPAPEPARILIGAETADIVDDGGNVLLSLRYSENGDEAVASAIDILGEPQATHHQDGSKHYPEMDGTSWGGFDIVVNRYRSERTSTDEASPYLPAFSVQATAATTAGGIAIASVDGTGVGAAFDAVSAGQDANRVHLDDAFGQRSVALDLTTSFPGIVVDPGIEMPYGVIGQSDQGSSAITKIVAPSFLFSQA